MLLRAAVAEGAILALRFGQANGVFVNARKHAGVWHAIRDAAQIIFTEEDADVSPVPSAAVSKSQIGRSQRVGIRLQARLHGGVVRIARCHAGQQRQTFDGTAVAVGEEIRVGEKLADELVAGIREDQRGLRTSVRSGAGIIAHDGHGDIHIGDHSCAPTFDSQRAGPGFFCIADRYAECLAAIAGEDRHGASARRHRAEDQVIHCQHGAARSFCHSD